MKKSIVIIGMGEMGGVFARGFLKAGYPVYPVTRDVDVETLAKNVTAVESVIVAVGEKGLEPMLETIPAEWKGCLVLLQNELLPEDWKKFNIDPTVISVWFEKKYPIDYKVIIPSPVFGPQAELVNEALSSINISCHVLKSEDDLLFELIVKNLYILTSNIAGMKVGGTVGELWSDHQELAKGVVSDVLDIQFHLAGQELDRDKLIEAMLKAFDGDRAHKCMGRSAPARLQRALSLADEAGLDVKTLKEIKAGT